MIKKKKLAPKREPDVSFDISSKPVATNPSKKKKKVTKEIEELPVKRLGLKKKKKIGAPAAAEETKKVKPKSTALTVLPNGQKRLSKVNPKELRSIIGDDIDEMHGLLEDGDTDKAIAMINRRLIQTLLDLIPQLENGIRDSNGRYGVHSLNGTISNIRELVMDLNASSDRGALGQNIVHDIIRPAILEIATKIVEEQATVLSEVKDRVTPDVYKDIRSAQIESRTRISSTIDTQYQQMREATISFLQR